MRFIQTLTRARRKAGVFALQTVVFILLAFSACQNPVQRQGDRTGTVSLTFGQGLEWTIMPPTGAAQFDKFEVVFSRDGAEVRRVWTYIQFAAGTVELAEGDWSLVVTAFRTPSANGSAGQGGNGGELEGFRRAAASGAISVSVTVGENSIVPVALYPITGAGYKGTFRWNINFTEGNLITSAEMVIWEYEDRTDAVETVDLLDADSGNYLTLPTGEYWVVITLGSSSHRVSGGLSKALRVYYNMYSYMEDWEFGNADLFVSPLGLILLAWDGNEWDFSGLEAWGFGSLTAPNFAIVGVAGINDDNFGYIETAFNEVVYWNDFFAVPDDVAELKQLVDAALISIGTDEHFRNNVSLYQSAVWAAIEAMVANETAIEPE